MQMEYIQSTGELFINGKFIAKGFAGAPGFINDPHSEHLENQGPLPRGRYKMTHLKYYKTKDDIRLTPLDESRMHGRSGMLIHGDSKEFPGTGSTGCIILPPDIRKKIAEEVLRGNDILEVK